MPTGPGAVDEHRKAILTQSIADDASVLETVHFNGVPTLAIEPAQLRDQNLRPADL
jgi:protein-disulfide isomerase-like protein with CxxC motif